MLALGRVQRRPEHLEPQVEPGLDRELHGPDHGLEPLGRRVASEGDRTQGVLQPAAKDLGYKPGDFPVCERQAREIVTLPAHQHLTFDQLDYVVEQVTEFYSR